MATLKKAKNPAHLFSMITKDLIVDSKLVLLEVSLDMKFQIRNRLLEWYNSYTPTSYDRTYDFLNSLTVGEPKKVRGQDRYEVSIFYDTDKWTVKYAGKSPFPYDMWTAHSSGSVLIELIEETGWKISESSKYRKASHSMENTVDEYEAGKFLMSLREDFKKLGYRVI